MGVQGAHDVSSHAGGAAGQPLLPLAKLPSSALLLFCSFGLLLFCSFALCLWRTTGEDDRLVVLVPGIGHGKEIYSR